MAFFVFSAAATVAGIIAAEFGRGVPERFGCRMLMVVIVIMIAVRAMHMWLLRFGGGHAMNSGRVKNRGQCRIYSCHASDLRLPQFC